MVEKSDWVSRVIESDEELEDLNDEIAEKHYKSLYKEEEKGRLLVSCGHPDYVRPPLSELWIPHRLVKKKQDTDAKTLDELEDKPIFKVLSERQSQCLPFVAREVLQKYGLYEKVVAQNPLLVEDNDSNCKEKLPYDANSRHSSMENLTNSEKLHEEFEVEAQQPLYEGDPIVYRKQADNVNIPQKPVKEKKVKKKQPKLQAALSLAEKYDPLNDLAPYTRHNKYFINLPASLQNATENQSSNSVRNDPSLHPFVINQLSSAQEEEKEPIIELDDFPNLTLHKKLSHLKNDYTQQPAQKSLWETEDSGDEGSIQLSDDIIVIENIPLSVSDEELREFLDFCGEIKIISKCKVDGGFTLSMKAEHDSSWIESCINDQSPFGASSEHLKCYVIKEDDS